MMNSWKFLELERVAPLFSVFPMVLLGFLGAALCVPLAYPLLSHNLVSLGANACRWQRLTKKKGTVPIVFPVPDKHAFYDVCTDFRTHKGKHKGRHNGSTRVGTRKAPGEAQAQCGYAEDAKKRKKRRRGKKNRRTKKKIACGHDCWCAH